MTIGEILAPALGGALIGLASLVLLALNGRVMGVSGIWSNVLRWSDGAEWRLAFVAGLIAAPFLIGMVRGGVDIQVDASLPLLAVAGLLVGFGTALGSGCTSGHGICGISRFSPRSLVATAVFLVTGIVCVTLVRHVIGGAV